MGDRSTEAITYLPASLLLAVAEGLAAGLPWHREVDGTMVMADLSGFTALSERLARLGDEGAERLTDIINSFFARMLTTASRFGGDTLTFGGDAILLMFDGQDHAGRAVAASLAMLKQVERAAAVDAGGRRIKIGMSVGAHSGTFALAAAGLAEERAHLFVLERGAELTALAEAQAERGELAVSSATRDLLPEGSAVTPTGDFWRVDEFPACVPPRVDPERAQVSEQQMRQLAPFLPPYARTGAGDGGRRVQHEPEHRRTVIVFVNILGLDEIIESAGIDAALEQLQAYSTMLTRLAAKHYGFVVSSDIATRGSKLVITFGTPVAHEYAPANAARFALDLNDGLSQSGLDLEHKIGLNGGHIFAGEVGPSFRRQYTVMGDDVNLAARLMGAAKPGEALISSKLLDYVSPDLCARELEPIKVKGKEEPVGVCVLEKDRRGGGQVRGGAGAQPREGHLVGRRAELSLMRDAWVEARAGRGCTILVEGEPGVGKTRLLEEALRGMADAARITRAACFEHLQAAPFVPWADAIHSVLAVSPDDSVKQRTEIVRAYLERHVARLADFYSLLNPLLNLSLTQSHVVKSLDAQSRREKLFELIAAILAEAGRDGGHVIVLEDLHWIDETSKALVRHLAEHAAEAPILLLLTTRPAEASGDLEGMGVGHVLLAELSESESLAMVREALRVTDLPIEVGEAVYVKTKGNPLFLEEVIHSLRAPGVLDRILNASSVTRAAELAALEIPDRVQGLLMSRIDRLPPNTREVLKAGSVVGRSFNRELLSGIDDPLLRLASVDRAFDELLAAALVVPAQEGDLPSVAFRHALVQDVAYESIPFARRRNLHGRVACYLESVQATPDHGLLVHHYERAGDARRTRFHAVRASESSVAVYASLEAIDYLALALDTARAPTPRDACLRSRFEELMGDSLEILSRSAEAIERYSDARRRWTSPRVRQACEETLRDLSPVEDADGRDSLLCLKIGVSLERGQSAYKRALRWLDLAAKSLPPHREGLSARVLSSKALTLYRLGRYRQAVATAEEAVRLAQEAGDLAIHAYALTTLGTTYSALGQLERSRDYYSQALPLFEEAGDLQGVATCHSNLGYNLGLIGDLQAAVEHGERSLTLFARLGNVNAVAFQHMNLGGMLLLMGQVPAALEHLEGVMRLRERQALSPTVVGYVLIAMCRAYVTSGDLEKAESALTDARQVLESLGSEDVLLDLGVEDAYLRLAQGDLEQARTRCETALEQARAMGAEHMEVDALYVSGRVKLARGDPEGAVPGLEACVALAEKVGSTYARALALTGLAEALAACGETAEACDGPLCEAVRVFERMGADRDLKEALELRERLRAVASL